MWRKALLAAVAAGAIAGAADAGVLLTTDAGYTGPSLNLAGYDNGSYNFTFGPVPVGPFTFTSVNGGGNSGKGSVVGQGGYGLAANGSFGGSAVYIGVDSATGYAQLLGTTAYNELGFFWNYAPGIGNDATISTLDAGGNVIQSFDLVTLAPISTPGGFNQFAFRGVMDSSADIYGMRFGGNYILASGTASGGLVGGGVPEPATWLMMVAGLFGLGAAMRSSRRRQALVVA